MPITVVDGDGYEAPDTIEPDCEWPIVMDCAPSTAFEPYIVDLAKLSAADIMNAATARRFGVCVSTFQPLPPEPCEVGHQDGWHLVDPKVGSDVGAARFGQFYYGTSCEGCGWYGCGCGTNVRIRLWHRRVIDVLRIVIDGVILPATAYHLEGNTLIRDDGDGWPTVQSGARGTVGTWEITYRHGVPLPKAGQIATGILACEIAKALSDDESCDLPERTKTYTNHAGLTIGFIDPMDFLADGLTGLYVPDQWIRRVNPHSLARRARAYSFGKRRRHARRVTNPIDLVGGLLAVYTGDIGQTVDVRLDGVDDLLTATAVEAHVWIDENAVTVLDAAITDADGRIVTVDLGDGSGWLASLNQAPGTIVVYNLQIQVTFPAGELTWPPNQLTVIGQAA